jgi:hypothetical protein
MGTDMKSGTRGKPLLEATGHSSPRLKLRGLEFFTHYAISLYLLTPTIASIYWNATHNHVSVNAASIRVICMWTLAASALLAWFQTRALRFRVIETADSARENYRKVIDAIGKTDWRLSQHRIDSQIVAKVPGAASWGERVEVRFHGTYVYVNSICDPSKWFQLIAWGDNLSNIAYIRQAVKGA